MELIELVIETIKVDIALGDYTAIEELLAAVPPETLLAYLPEDVAEDWKNDNPVLTTP